MTFEKLKSLVADGGGEHLGDVVWWALSDARVERLALEALWQNAGLDPALLPEAPTAEKALKSAVREAAVGQGDRLIRLAKEAPDEIVFAVVREVRPGDGTLDYAVEASIHLDRQREVLTSDVPNHDLVGAVEGRFKLNRMTHSADDVRRSVVKTLDTLAAITLRDHGGVYFVPSPHADKLRRLQGAVEKIGSSRVYLLPIHHTEDSQRTLAEAAQGSIEAELLHLQTEMREFLATPPERASTLLRRLDAYQALRQRAQLYRTVLHAEVIGLDEQLRQLGDAVETLLNEKALSSEKALAA